MTDTAETQKTEAAAPKKEKAPKPPKAPKDIKNDVTRPKEGTSTRRVWDIADEISRKTGEPAGRKAVLEAFVAEGGNTATGATQYGRWRRYNGLANTQGGPGRPKKEKPAKAAASEDTKVETA